MAKIWTWDELKANTTLTPEQKAEIWLKQNMGSDYDNIAGADEGFSGFWADWLDFSYNKAPEAVDKVVNGFKVSLKWILAGAIILILIIYNKQIKKWLK